MPTERIYQKDRYKTANTAEITAVREINGFDTFTCTSSVFYPLGGGLTQKMVRGAVSQALAMMDDSADYLPVSYRQGKMGRPEAIRTMHLPKSFEDQEAARSRLAAASAPTRQALRPARAAGARACPSRRPPPPRAELRRTPGRPA